jgi:hypothetical protein
MIGMVQLSRAGRSGLEIQNPLPVRSSDVQKLLAISDEEFSSIQPWNEATLVSRFAATDYPALTDSPPAF